MRDVGAGDAERRKPCLRCSATIRPAALSKGPVTRNTFQSKLDELQQQLNMVQQFSLEDPGQLRELLPVVLPGLQKSLADLQPTAAEVAETETPVPAARNGGQHPDPRLGHARRFRVMAEWSPGLVRLMGADSRCRWANHTWSEFTGRGRNELLGEGWLESVHPEDRARCRDTCHEAFEANRLYRIEYRLERAGGGFGWILEVGTPRFDSLGAAGGYFGVATEITAQKQAELHLTVQYSAARVLAEAGILRDVAAPILRSLCENLGRELGELWTLDGALRAPRLAKLEGSLQEIAQLIDQTNQAAHSIGFELSPPVLHDLGLVPALQWLVENLRARYGIRIDLVHEPRLAATDERSCVLVFRSVHELLIHAAKHAGARQVCVRLRAEAGELHVSVEDDGTGTEQAGAAEQGSALLGIQGRMDQVGGGMQIESVRGQGTKVRLRVPLAGTVEREAGART